MSGFRPSRERRDPFSFHTFSALFAATVLFKTFDVRMQLFHRGPNKPPPCPASDPCHACLELHNDVLLRMFSKWPAWREAGQDVAAQVGGFAAKRALDIQREHQTELGRVAKVSAALEAKWVIGALPAPIHRELLGLIMHHARSDDAPEAGSDWPENRFASKTGLDVQEVHRLVEEIPRRLSAISPNRAGWVQRNVFDALAEHQARCDIECFEEQLPGWEPASTDPGPEEEVLIAFAASDPVPSSWADEQTATGHELQLDFRRRVLDGDKPEVALRLAASEVLPEADAQRLCEDPQFNQLAQDLWAS